MADGLIIKPMDKRSAWAWDIHQPTKLSKNRPENHPRNKIISLQRFLYMTDNLHSHFLVLSLVKDKLGREEERQVRSGMDIRPTISAALE